MSFVLAIDQGTTSSRAMVFRGDTSIADRARFDNHYIDTWSLWQDVTILVRTACTVFRFGGS